MTITDCWGMQSGLEQDSLSLTCAQQPNVQTVHIMTARRPEVFSASEVFAATATKGQASAHIVHSVEG